MASKLLCLLAMIAAASAAVPGSRLMGGSPLDVSDAPYVVSIKYTYPGPGITIQRCVGSLISSWHVVTTAFCFSGANLQNMRVQAGSTNSLQGGVSSAVTSFVAHPDYQASPRSADVAVLFAAQPFPITNLVNVLFLPSSGFEIPTGTDLKVVGWGFSVATGAIQLSDLHSVDLVTISQDNCKAAFAGSDDIAINDKSICAEADGKGLCRGDSGSPAIIANSNILVGVASSDSCGGDTPDVLVNVPSVSAWIVSVAVAPSGEGVPVRTAVV